MSDRPSPSLMELDRNPAMPTTSADTIGLIAMKHQALPG
jgi:hypothetical protein